MSTSLEVLIKVRNYFHNWVTKNLFMYLFMLTKKKKKKWNQVILDGRYYILNFRNYFVNCSMNNSTSFGDATCELFVNTREK